MPIYKHKGRLIYFAHVPKCGGTSVEYYLARRIGPPSFMISRFRNGVAKAWTRTSPQHIPWKQLGRLFAEDFFDESFTVVREPSARFLSAFRFQKDVEKSLPESMTIDEMLDRLSRPRFRNRPEFDNHFRLQTEIVPPKAKVFHLEDGLDKVAEHIDLITGTPAPTLSMPHKLPSKEHELAMEPRQIRQIEEIYAADFERFGYEKTRGIRNTPSRPTVAVSRETRVDLAIKSPYQAGKKHSWGERTYAQSLAAAFEDIGVSVRVDDADDWERHADADEAVLLIRGKLAYPYAAPRAFASWMISELITNRDELRDTDANLFASAIFLEANKERREADAVLFQATDKRYFHPGRSNPGGPTLFVGNNYRRWDTRPVIARMLAEDLPVDVYGDRWDRKLGPDRLKGVSVTPAELGDLYRGAGVVLNDHRPVMRENGLVSNRIFDVLACGVPLISDRIAGLPDGFEEFIYVFDEETTLADLISQARSESRSVRKRREEFAEHVVREYSFHAAARKFAEILGIRMPV